MLQEVYVKNLALIDEAEISFGPGLNILTGETGAGKSILIGSINFALGQRISPEMVREGADSALVELCFVSDRPAVFQKLEEFGIDAPEHQIILTRKLKNGRSTSRINGETVSIAGMREISALLLDIHGQHSHQTLLYPEHQLEILDAYGRDEIASLKKEAEKAYQAFKQAEALSASYEMEESLREREIAFLTFETEEIREANLQEGEEETLESDYRKMSNSRKIAETLGVALQLSGDESGAGGMISRALREISAVSELDEEIGTMEAQLTDVEAVLSEFTRNTERYLEDFVFSEEELQQTEQRLDLIRRLENKYGKTISEVLEACKEKEDKLSFLLHMQEGKEQAAKELEQARGAMERIFTKLSESRQAAAKKLSKQIKSALSDLNFLSVQFEIFFRRTEHFHANGFDQIEFGISTNPGEPIRPLAKIVSGGELSRIMLAIKTLLADKDQTETLIFDEIDTGISGRTAQRVSEKMAQIGAARQVICITHLAQIAAMADRHYRIEKTVKDGKTVSMVSPLDEKQSIDELARILGGTSITTAVLENAQEMKSLAEQWKGSRGSADNPEG